MWTKIRLRSVWAMIPLYLLFARPTVTLMLVGLAFAVTGALVRAWAAGAIRKNQMLTTHGPYAFTRNPLYFGSFLIGIGFGIASGRVWILAMFAVFFVLIYGKTMKREEKRLGELFGEEFERYAEAVPRFVPRPTAWSHVTGATSPARPATVSFDDVHDGGIQDGGVATMAPPAIVAPVQFKLRHYVKHREYQALLGIAVMYLLLVAKLAL